MEDKIKLSKEKEILILRIILFRILPLKFMSNTFINKKDNKIINVIEINLNKNTKKCNNHHSQKVKIGMRLWKMKAKKMKNSKLKNSKEAIFKILINMISQVTLMTSIFDEIFILRIIHKTSDEKNIMIIYLI